MTAAALAVLLAAVPAAVPDMAIRGATIIDGTGREPLRDATLVVLGGRIDRLGPRAHTEVPKGVRVIEARGAFVIPGLADMHNHLGTGVPTGPDDDQANLKGLLAFGITTVFDPALELDRLSALKGASAGARYPRFFGTGPAIGAEGGWLTGEAPRSPEEIEETMARLAGRVDAVKVVHDDMSWLVSQPLPLMKPETLRAVVASAHARRLKVFVHAPILRLAKEALAAGVDGLLHGIVSDPVDDEFLGLMKRNRAFYVSTLAVFEACADLGSWVGREQAFDLRPGPDQPLYELLRTPDTIARWQRRWDRSASVKQKLPVLRANVKRVAEAGIPVALGTDTGVLGVVLGVSTPLEATLHVEAGLAPAQVLRSATLEGARMLGREADLGSLEPGKLADLVVLDADPLADLGNLRRIRMVVKEGLAP
jgi:imidazolonepropionase-like amidohydrolase